MPETCDANLLDPQNPFFIKDKQNLHIQNVGHIWAYIHANYQDFWKKLTDPIRQNMSKMWLKNAKKLFFKTLFGALPKIGDWIWKYE